MQSHLKKNLLLRYIRLEIEILDTEINCGGNSARLLPGFTTIQSKHI
jgi:hypothetical protein